MSAFVALLREVNVGGHNKVPMAALRARLTAVGFGDVQTLIQSGNIVLDADATEAEVGLAVERVLQEAFGVRAPVVVRSAADLLRIETHPHAGPGAEEKLLHVGFLGQVPDPATVAALPASPDPAAPFTVRGREVYVHYGNGVARSKLTNDWLDRRLGTPATFRNWRTVGRIRELAAQRQ